MNKTLTKGRIRNSAEARDFWARHSLRQRKIVSHYFARILNVLKGQVNSFIRYMDEHGYSKAKANIHTIVEFQPVAKVIKSLYQKSAYIESNYVLSYLKDGQKRAPIGITFNDLGGVVDEYFKIYLLNNSALPITEYTRKLISTHLFDQVDTGVPLDEAIKNFKDLAVTWTGVGGRSFNRAKLIAQTETTMAMSFGQLIGAYMSGIDVDKVWVTSEDERVRGYWPTPHAPFPHTALDLQKTELMGAFYNGEKIKFPGDPEASIANVAGCRCSMYFREKARPKPTVLRRLKNFIRDMFVSNIISDVIINDLRKPRDVQSGN